MAGENTVSSSDGLYKERHAKELQNLVPNSSILYRDFKFDEENKLGDSYHAPVVLTNEHGFTYGGTAGAVNTLNAAVNAVIKDATATGYEQIGRARLSYAVASRAAAGGAQAFKKAWGLILMNLKLAAMKRQELTLLRGQMALGKVSSVSTGVVTITDDSWSAATWIGMEGAVLEAFTTQAATATQHDTDLTVTAISFTNKTVTVSGTSTSVTTGDYLFFKGAKTTTSFNEAAGLVKVAQNSGSLQGIDAASYAIWGGNAVSSLGSPTMGRILNATSRAVEKGLDEKAKCIVPIKAWEVLNGDLSSSRMFDGSYSKTRAENGTSAISYYGQAGELEVQAHPFLWDGELCIYPMSTYKRVGSAEVGMGVPGTPDSREVFFHIEASSALEARSYSDQVLFCDKPSTSVYASGITYS